MAVVPVAASFICPHITVQVLHASDEFCHANFSSLGLLGSNLLPEEILAILPKQVCDSTTPTINPVSLAMPIRCSWKIGFETWKWRSNKVRYLFPNFMPKGTEMAHQYRPSSAKPRQSHTFLHLWVNPPFLPGAHNVMGSCFYKHRTYLLRTLPGTRVTSWSRKSHDVVCEIIGYQIVNIT